MSSSPTTASSSSRLVSIQPSASSSAAAPNSSSSSRPPDTPLQPYTSPTSKFTFPAIWSFPPFFTLQPNPETLSHQLSLWTALVLSWARHTRTWQVNVDAAQQDLGEVFYNRQIQRRLRPEGMRAVMGHLVKEGKAAPDPPKSTSTYLLYWRNPEEWGSVIYDWIVENGMTGTIMTFYEITEGDLAYTTEFYELHPSIFRKALDSLVKKGRAQLLKGEGEAGDGVRFLSI